MRILQITVHFSPNLGGVETHIDDLISALEKLGHDVFVLTYRPLQTKVDWKIFEKMGKIRIMRIPWIPGLFYRLLDKPLFELIYLLPGIFIFAPFMILLFKPDVLHAHGIIAGIVAVFWGKVFGIRSVISTHNIYHVPTSGLYRNFCGWVFNNADHVLCLSQQSADEIKSIVKEKGKVGVFTSWVDLNKFKAQSSKLKAKQDIGWEGKFVVLFVGRLVEEKGILILLEAAKKWNKNITLAVAGTGPLEENIKHQSSNINNLVYLGKVDNDELPKYYNAADVTIVPSIHEEGFGRVIPESLACGTPVIGSNRGAIPEVLNNSVGKVIDISAKEIKETVEFYYKNKNKLEELAKNARGHAKKSYSVKNIEKIFISYKTS